MSFAPTPKPTRNQEQEEARGFARMKSEIEKEIEEDTKWLNQLEEKETKREINYYLSLRGVHREMLKGKKQQLLVDEKMVREEIEMQMKNDDRGLTPTKDVLRLILNRLGLSEEEET